MATLQEIIKGNIEWFWDQDPSVWFHEKLGYTDLPVMVDDTNVEKLWNNFKVWCLQNCKEVCDGKDAPFVEAAAIEAEVNACYEGWLNWQREKYPDRVHVTVTPGGKENKPSLADQIAGAMPRAGQPAARNEQKALDSPSGR